MKKSTLIRSDKPHSVQVTEGSSVAQRKSSAKKSATPESTAPLKNIQAVPVVKVAKSQRVTASKVPVSAVKAAPLEAAKPPTAKARPKVKSKQQAKPVPTPVPKTATSKSRKATPRKSPKPKEPLAEALAVDALTPELPVKPTAPSAPTAPALPIWEQDNPVKARIEELQALNAQLTEQLQRLPTTRSLRGAKP
jgi:hypothetical protein